jgi:uncharacterized protein (TIGR02680 family)
MAIAFQDHPRAFQPAVDVGRGPRWTLSRAGIVNVYQYDNEVLEFGGGRLLLRGVNGSGKSTAMNMLLPFLLDGDTRRIDAAGEQSGVLKAWMLSGREETQPQGYLWLEVARGDEHLTFGCGIRASKAADQVTTWWFITSRRPGFDLQFVEGRAPLGRDALRNLIAPDPLYSQEQRAEYRAELSRRLFGGADIEQHLHLLRIVRNPRVGDRLDAELPQYLQDALPRLSDAALEDAAQPLENLEEHRHHVADLTKTAEALEAIHATYRAYARTELLGFADLTGDAVRNVGERRREEERKRTEHATALETRDAARTAKAQLEAETLRLRERIAALKESDVYKDGTQLNELRAHVKTLRQTAEAARGTHRSWQAACEKAANHVREAHREAVREHESLERRLSDLTSLSSACRLITRPPAAPPLLALPEPPHGLLLPASGLLDTAGAERTLGLLADAARQRTDEVKSVAAAVRRIEPLERGVAEAERAVGDARGTHQEAGVQLAAARSAFQASVDTWQAAATGWLLRLTEHQAAHGLADAGRPAVLDAVVDEVLESRHPSLALEVLVSPVIQHHEAVRAQHKVALAVQGKMVAELTARAAELAAKQLPDPPLLPWQARHARSLAELVDFVDSVEPGQRAGLEAALEASGLLAAEVQADGTLRLVDGQLMIAPDEGEVSAPLSALLRPELPPDAQPLGPALERILRTISTDLASGARTVVSVAGEFRVGAVRGRFAKRAPEHIGVSARRAALERQRAETQLLLAQAQEVHATLEALLEQAHAALNEAQSLRKQVPSDQPLHTALWNRQAAQRGLEKAAELLRARIAAFDLASLKHSEAVAEAHGLAVRLDLPEVLAQLDETRQDLDRVLSDSAEARRRLADVARAVVRWRDQGVQWRDAQAEEVASRERVETALQTLMEKEARLEALDATIGVDYQKVADEVRAGEDRLEVAQHGLKGQEQALSDAERKTIIAEKDRDQAAVFLAEADAACLKSLGVLRQVLATPGLVQAAADVPQSEPAAEFLAVEDTVAGARTLVESIRAQVPGAEGEETSAESVRQSIRRRRDTLGAGWDAEDRQPDPALPLHVQVTDNHAAQMPLPVAARLVQSQRSQLQGLLTVQQQQALRNLLQGLVAREIADKLQAAQDLVARMNQRLAAITTSHGIGVRLRWKQQDGMEPALAETIGLLAKKPDLRTAEEDGRLSAALGRRIDEAHREDPGTPYRELIARVLDYRQWHEMRIMLQRPGRPDEHLSRRTALSEGEKKMVSYLPLFAAVAASCDGLSAEAPDALRFLLLDDAFAKVSEDNHPKLFGLLVELDLDFIATSERLWGTYPTVPELAIIEVIRDAESQAIVLEHARWNGSRLELLQ